MPDHVPGERQLEVLESITGMLGHWKSELHPRGRTGEFRELGGKGNAATSHKPFHDLERNRQLGPLKADLARVRANRAAMPRPAVARDVQDSMAEERRIMAQMHTLRGRANRPAGDHHQALQDVLDKIGQGGWRIEPTLAWTSGSRVADSVTMSKGGTEHFFSKGKDGKWRLSGTSVMGNRQGIGHGFHSGFDGAANEDASGVHVTDPGLLATLERTAVKPAGKANPDPQGRLFDSAMTKDWMRGEKPRTGAMLAAMAAASRGKSVRRHGDHPPQS